MGTSRTDNIMKANDQFASIPQGSSDMVHPSTIKAATCQPGKIRASAGTDLTSAIANGWIEVPQSARKPCKTALNAQDDVLHASAMKFTSTATSPYKKMVQTDQNTVVSTNMITREKVHESVHQMQRQVCFLQLQSDAQEPGGSSSSEAAVDQQDDNVQV
jgi:hypothetical protein